VVLETRVGRRSATGPVSTQTFCQVPRWLAADKNRQQPLSQSLELLLRSRSVRLAANVRHHGL